MKLTGFSSAIDQRASAALGAVGKCVDGERFRHRAGGETELVAVAVDLLDADPREQHLHLHSLQGCDGQRLNVAGDAAAVLDPHAAGAEAAVRREVHLEGAIGVEDRSSIWYAVGCGGAGGVGAGGESSATEATVRVATKRRVTRRWRCKVAAMIGGLVVGGAGTWFLMS
jgi:hypothetical protein